MGWPRLPPSNTTWLTPRLLSPRSRTGTSSVRRCCSLVAPGPWPHERLSESRSRTDGSETCYTTERIEIDHERSADDHTSSGADDRCGSGAGQFHADAPMDGPRIH